MMPPAPLTLYFVCGAGFSLPFDPRQLPRMPRIWNRWKLLHGYLTGRTRLNALPVEYIVETTAKCNLYCPMCPRETHKQPKADMEDEIFQRLVQESGSSAEHMMLIGLGEPFMDRKIFDRIEYCE
ncbi:MAG: Radical domain protein, partial [Bryobacterales bacterium]|nr:Radical domain protein [Bryobacterales bacterium]